MTKDLEILAEIAEKLQCPLYEMTTSDNPSPITDRSEEEQADPFVGYRILKDELWVYVFTIDPAPAFPLLLTLQEIRHLCIREFDLREVGMMHFILDKKEEKESHYKKYEPLGQLTGLKSLDLMGCRLTQMDFVGNLTALERLNARESHLEDISFLRPLSKLRILNLAHNWIKDVSPLTFCTALTKLDISSNQRMENPELIGKLISLEHLKMKLVCLKDLSFLSTLTQLRTLRISNNQIGDIEFVRGMKKLTRLHADICAIEQGPEGWEAEALEYVDLSSNKLRDVSFLGKAPNVAYLDLWNNRIQDLKPLSRLKKLTCLKLMDNQVEDLTPIETLQELVELDVASNPITRVAPLTGLKKLRKLYIRNNKQMEDAPLLANLTQLKHLGISNCALGKCDFLEPLRQLENLQLAHNDLKEVSHLGTLTALSFLQLGFNEIPEEQWHFLLKLPNLKQLYARGNPKGEKDYEAYFGDLPRLRIYLETGEKPNYPGNIYPPPPME